MALFTRLFLLNLDSAEYLPSEENPDIMVTDSMSYFDPRLICLGCRIICPTDSLEIDENIINKKINEDDYEVIRLLYGILEGDEVENQFPLNLNFQYLNEILLIFYLQKVSMRNLY